MNGPFRAFSELTQTQCASLIQILSETKSLAAGKQIHAAVIASGRRPFLLLSKLVAVYSLCGHLIEARYLFDEIPMKSRFLYNTLIRYNVNSGFDRDALLLFYRMVSSGLSPDHFTYPFALKACGGLSLIKTGAQIHCRVIFSGFAGDGFVRNSMMAMYMSCGREEAAARVFNDPMGSRNVISWNTMIAGLFRNECADEALVVFDRMMGSNVGIDPATVMAVLPACGQLKDFERGRRVHELVEENGLGVYLPVRNSLVDMYSKCGRLEEARRVFDGGTQGKDVISWTSMIGGYALNGYPIESLALAHRMQSLGIRPNSVTMASLLSVCASLPSTDHGKCIHGSCIRLCLYSDIIVETALIDMYAKCGSMDLGSRVFVRGSRRTATWNAIISSYTRGQKAQEAIGHFKLMVSNDVSPDLATVASVLPSYGSSSDLREANNIHCYLIRMGFLRSIAATTGLVDVYARVGCLDIAWELFDGLPVKDVVSWSSIITGYGMHGEARTVIKLFHQMVESGFEPNEITFTSVLYSCSHAGLVDEGLNIFMRMLESHVLRPSVDHYACIVDLLGRAGRLEEAHGLIKRMPYEPNYAVWGALLGACLLHENVELGEMAAKHLFEIEPENSGNYIILGNIYAATGRWEDAEAVRTMMVERGVMKAPGCSSVEVRNL